MIVLQLKESDWKPYDSDSNLLPMTPYWFKRKNGDIVLSTYLDSGYSRGWAVTYFDESGKLVMKSNEFYILKESQYQDALIDS